MDHDDPDVNNVIQILKKNSDNRSPADLNELMGFVKNVDFFKEYSIVGRDLLDVCEYLTYERKD